MCLSPPAPLFPCGRRPTAGPTWPPLPTATWPPCPCWPPWAAPAGRPGLLLLAALGCPWGGRARPLPHAIHDTTLPRKTEGLPWNQPANDVNRHRDCAWQRTVCSLRGLQALVAAGCPVRWRAALAAGRRWKEAEVLA